MVKTKLRTQEKAHSGLACRVVHKQDSAAGHVTYIDMTQMLVLLEQVSGQSSRQLISLN